MKLSWCLSAYLMVIIIIGLSSLAAVHGKKVISSTVQCATTYKPFDRKVECTFNLFNNGDDVIFVSKWFTPLEGIKSDCFKMTHNGKTVKYDGIFLLREHPPSSKSYVRIAPKRFISKKVDLSRSYRIDQPGKYTVMVNIHILYYYHTKSPQNKLTISLKSNQVNFKITRKAISRKTTGELQRMSDQSIPASLSSREYPLNPRFSGREATYARLEKIEKLHRTAYHYIKASALEVMEDPEHFKVWFGTDLTYSYMVTDNYNEIVYRLETHTITYNIFGPECYDEQSTIAYVYGHSNTIFLCPIIFTYKDIASSKTELTSKMSVLIHELTHLYVDTDDFAYGGSKTKKLARDEPDKALRNADNYEYFSQTTYPFNYGIDAMTVYPNGYVYIFKENVYARLGKGRQEPFSLDSNYPRLVDGAWGNLKGEFKNGFDTIFRCGTSKYTYATKGPLFVRYSGSGDKDVDDDYPKQIDGSFGDLNKEFNHGFDSASHLPDGSTYVSQGNRFIRYDDGECDELAFHSFPNIAGYWGKIPQEFNNGFDSMLTTESGIFVTKGRQFVRYSDENGSEADSGYPKNIRGHFGEVKY